MTMTPSANSLVSTAMRYLPFEQTQFTNSLRNINQYWGMGRSLAGLAGGGAYVAGLPAAATAMPGMAGYGMAEGAGMAGVIGTEGLLSGPLAFLSEILGPLGIVAGLASTWYGNQAARRKEHHAMDTFIPQFNSALDKVFGKFRTDPEGAMRELYAPPPGNTVLSDAQIQSIGAMYMAKIAQQIDAASGYTPEQKQALMNGLAQKYAASVAQAKAAGGTIDAFNQAGIQFPQIPAELKRQAMLKGLSDLEAASPWGRNVGANWELLDIARNALTGPKQWYTQDQWQQLADIKQRYDAIPWEYVSGTGYEDPGGYRKAGMDLNTDWLSPDYLRSQGWKGGPVDMTQLLHQEWVMAGRPQSGYQYNMFDYGFYGPGGGVYANSPQGRQIDLQTPKATQTFNQYGLNSVWLYGKMQEEPGNEVVRNAFLASIGQAPIAAAEAYYQAYPPPTPPPSPNPPAPATASGELSPATQTQPQLTPATATAGAPYTPPASQITGWDAEGSPIYNPQAYPERVWGQYGERWVSRPTPEDPTSGYWDTTPLYATIPPTPTPATAPVVPGAARPPATAQTPPVNTMPPADQLMHPLPTPGTQVQLTPEAIAPTSGSRFLRRAVSQIPQLSAPTAPVVQAPIPAPVFQPPDENIWSG